MNKLQVAIIEPTIEFHPDLEEHYSKFFSLAGYSSHFECVPDEKELKRLLRSRTIDIVITDLSFRTDDFLGLLVAQSLKKEFPEIFCIGNSKADVGYRQTASKLPTFDMFIEKGALIGGDKVYIKLIIDEFLLKFKRNTGISIDDRSVLPNELNNGKSFLSLTHLLSQVTFSIHCQDELLNGTVIQLTPLYGGRSGSYVFKLNSKNKTSNISAIPAVLKISKRKYAEKELENYNRFVKWVLPYKWRVDLLGTGFTKSWGALCYSFILSGYEDFDSLTHYLRTSDKETVLKVIEKVFNPGQKRWYAEELISSEDNINARYMSRYYLGTTNKEQMSTDFSRYCQELFNDTVITKNNIQVFGKKYSLPVDRLFGQPNGPYKSCICHGDMNSNNVIVAKNGEIIFIDFQNTGRGHVFEDFITMEASIRINYYDKLKKFNADRIEWQDFFKWERNIEKPEAINDLPESYQLISRIRELAKNNFTSENFKNYYYGVAAFNARLLRIPKFSSFKIGKILVSVLTAMENLG